MTQTTIFKNNRTQAVRIPKDLEFPEGTKKVSITRVGDARLIAPADRSWDSWFEGEAVTADFMAEREQPADQERDSLA